MTLSNPIDLNLNILSELKIEFENFRASMTHKKVNYPESLKLKAVSALDFLHNLANA